MVRNERAWMEQDAFDLLIEYAKMAKGDIVELGTYRGGSTEAMALVAPNITVWSIDIYTDDTVPQLPEYNPVWLYHKIMKNLGNVILIIGETDIIGINWKLPIAILYIDANHDFDPMWCTFRVWSRFVVPDGYVIIHDYCEEHKGVYDMVNDLLDAGVWVKVAQAGSMIVLQRCVFIKEN
jgi:hypothetical protein